MNRAILTVLGIVLMPAAAIGADFVAGGNQLLGACWENDGTVVIRWQTIAGPERPTQGLERSYRTVLAPAWAQVFPGFWIAAADVAIEDRETGEVVLAGTAWLYRFGGPAFGWVAWTGGTLAPSLATGEGSITYSDVSAGCAFELR